MKQTLNVSLEIKSLGAREFEGHGSIFGNIDLGGDIVMPGAFKRSLAQHKKAGTLPQMFWMHRMDQVPGRWLEMEEDSKGLYVKGELADTPLGNEMHTLLKMKAVRGQSIGYEVPAGGAQFKDGKRELHHVNLLEVSLVSLAMNPLAQVEGVKSRLSARGVYVPTEREFEEFLRDPAHSPLGRLSKDGRRFLTAKLFASSGGMPDLSMYDDASGGMPDDEVDETEEALVKALNGLTDRFGAAAITG